MAAGFRERWCRQGGRRRPARNPGERVFEPGYSTDEEGSGLRLASARQIVVAHGWEITATEGTDGGARFEVTDVDPVPDGADEPDPEAAE